ncbi:hypothetical protein RD055328_08430 [Companilactobacillus sp. RD055328]|uniref:minor capsid protein n=1 Tax=Companilactobacillus sp. RD055328 TaxID=2916634 RepID=UPI001FC7EDD2|nr:minor capsid protein [Companilactobacillus sp. RD055328]GKQ42920.1 hypothetical protein RD055328_08430 [Companilactobacillus sp. RD055328]
MARTDYWRQREQEWIKQQILSDDKIAKEIEKRFQQSLNQMTKDINAFYTSYAKSQNISMSEAMKRVKDFDTKLFADEAKRLVKNKDFSQEANKRLKLYNATMRINRLEYLKSQVGMELAKTNADIEKLMGNKLNGAYVSELKRQAGILGQSLPVDLVNKAGRVVGASFHGASWSSRLWSSMDELKSTLDDSLTKAMIQGLNPRKIASDLLPSLKDNVLNKRYAAERLARTEMARVQDSAQMDSYKKYGFEEVEWIAEPGACSICAPGDGRIFDIKYAPQIPVHPNCRCSKAVHVGRDTDSNNNSNNDKGFINNDFFDKSALKDLNEKISEIPNEKLRNAYKDALKNAKFVKGDSSFYNPISKVISIKPNEWNIKNRDVYFHEMGHYIDHTYNGEFGDTVSGVTLNNAASLDYRKLKKDFKTNYKEDFDLYGEMGWNNYFNKRYNKSVITDSAFADISDIICARTKGKSDLGWGHTSSYWKDYHKKDLEAFAEISSAIARNDDSLKLIKEIFPNLYKEYLRLIEERL